jgi:hypothetical protein
MACSSKSVKNFALQSQVAPDNVSCDSRNKLMLHALMAQQGSSGITLLTIIGVEQQHVGSQKKEEEDEKCLRWL